MEWMKMWGRGVAFFIESRKLLTVQFSLLCVLNEKREVFFVLNLVKMSCESKSNVQIDLDCIYNF